MLGISKDSFLVAVDPNQYKESADGSTDLRQGGMESNSSMAPLLWSSPLLDLGRKHYGRIDIIGLEATSTKANSGR